MTRDPDLASLGNDQLDHVLRGGLPRDAMYLLQGVPGSGKTTLALQFLLEAARNGETALYVTLSETKREILRIADSHGWDLASLHILELAAMTSADPARQTMFHSADVELKEVTTPILEWVERTEPSAVVIDSLSEIRLLSGDLLRFRRQILAMKQFFARRRCTVLLLDDRTDVSGSSLLESLAHGVLTLEKESPRYGRTRRRLSVDKLRGVPFREGFHDFRIERGRFVVFPRLVAGEHRSTAKLEALPSGIATLDALLGGGPDRGTSTLIMGPAGVGKSTVATQYCVAAAQRGEHSAIFIFDESVETLAARSESLQLPVRKFVDAGLISLRPVDPAELTAGEFSHIVREAVTRDEARIVVIDSVNGFMDSVPDEQFLTLHLRELLTYLNHHGIATFSVLAQHGLVAGADAHGRLDVSYLADNVILMRYFEARGLIKQAISVFKKRSGRHERTVREFSLSGGITVGEPLAAFQGILTGVPTLLDDTAGPPGSS